MVLFHVGGVPVRMHRTLWLMLVLVFAWSVVQGGLAGLFSAVWWVSVFVGSVLWHELGHVVVASRYGIVTESIVLLPVGGAAQMQLRGARPTVDAVVSVAGPAASLLLGLLCAVAGWSLHLEWLLTVGVLNGMLGVFNLIPAFPMDGGRILRALLVSGVGQERGTMGALVVGAGFALAFGVLGVLYREWGMMLLAAFMGLLQWREYRVQQWLKGHSDAVASPVLRA